MSETLPPSVQQALLGLLDELTAGAPDNAGFILNPRDPGLLHGLDRLSAEDASAEPGNGAAPIAAHVDHVRYGFELLNRWSRGENPYADANWAASWQRRSVTEEGWRELRGALRREVQQAREVFQRPREVNQIELSGVIGIVAHLAYHLGAMRQIDRALRGPPATD